MKIETKFSLGDSVVFLHRDCFTRRVVSRIEISVPSDTKQKFKNGFAQTVGGKPPAIVEKIVAGKMQKWYAENCLLNQPFIKNDTFTVDQLIKNVSSTLGEKIELKRFIKMATSNVPYCREDGCH